jgi:hypothetical protein
VHISSLYMLCKQLNMGIGLSVGDSSGFSYDHLLKIYPARPFSTINPTDGYFLPSSPCFSSSTTMFSLSDVYLTFLYFFWFLVL